MSRPRHFRILALVTLAVLLASGILLFRGKGKYYVYGEADNDLVALLRAEGSRVRLYSSADLALEKARRHSAVLLLGGGYPDHPQTLTPEQRSLIRQKGLRVFADFVTLREEPQLREIQFERVVVKQPLGTQEPMDLLSVNRAVCCVEEAPDTVLCMARVAGFDKAVFGLEGTPSFPLVYRMDGGCVWASTSCLSDFARLRLMPEKQIGRAHV